MLFGKKPTPPALVATDTIVPFHFKDDGLMKNVIMDFYQLFDDVLDPERVHSAIEQLITQNGEWRKCGARIRENKATGKTEFHIPTHFDRQTRRAVDFHHYDHPMPIEEHPIYPMIPRATGVPQTYACPVELEQLVAPHGIPGGVAHWVDSDCPLIIFTVVTFTNASLISIKWSHSTMDGVTIQAFWQGITAVLSNKPEKIPVFAGFDEDPLLPLASKTPGEQYALHHMCSSGWVFAKFAINFIKEMALHKAEQRYICIPGAYFEEMKRMALAEARAKATDPKAKIWLSENDVVLSWWSKTVVAALEIPEDVPIAISNTMDIRDFTYGKIPRNSMYMGNALDSAVTFMTAGELLSQPLTAISLRTRNDMVRLRTQQQIEAKMALDKAAGGTQFLGPANQVQLLLTNWRKFDFYGFDFSGAILPGSDSRKERTTRPGQPATCFFATFSKMNLRNVGPVIGKDSAGNWWLQWRLRTSAWPNVEKRLLEMTQFGWQQPQQVPSKL